MPVDSLIIAATMTLCESGKIGLMVEAPKWENKLWLVSSIGGQIFHSRSLAESTYKLMSDFDGSEYPIPEGEDSVIAKAALNLAKLGDALLVFRLQSGMWVFQAEKNKYLSVGEDFPSTLNVFSQMVQKHISLSLYANDNCPLD